jgi:hypothetical protein
MPTGTFNINQINVNVTDVIPPDNFATITKNGMPGNTYSIVEDNVWRAEVEQNVTSGIKGIAKPDDTVPTTGFFRMIANTADTYTNYLDDNDAPIVVTADDLNIVNGVQRNEVIIEVTIGVAEKKVFAKVGADGANGTTTIPQWVAGDYSPDAMVLKDFVQYIAPNGATATDIPNDDSLIWKQIGSNVASIYDANNSKEAVSAKILDVEYFGGIKGSDPKSLTTYTDWSIMSTATGAPSVGIIYTPLFPVNSGEVIISQLKLKGLGEVKLYVLDSSFSPTLLDTLNLVIDGENTFSGLSYILPSNSRIGMTTGVGGKLYFDPSGLGVRTYASSPPGEYNITMALQYSFDNSTTTPVNGKVNDIVEAKILEIPSDSGSNLELFSDDFSSDNGKWIAPTWTLNTGNKTYTSSLTGRSNNLFLDKVYNLNQRKVTFKLIPSANTDFRIELKNKTAGNEDGASMFSINFAEGKLKIFNVLLGSFPNPEIASAGVSETSVLKSENLIPFVSGREYVVELKFNDMAHTLTVTDSRTAQKSVLYFNGWSGGRQQQSYSFYIYSGGMASVKNVKVHALQDHYDTIFAGDSITEGIMVYDKSKRWWKLMEPSLKGIIGVSARGGQSLQDLINRFPDELAIIKPKFLVVLIGINNPGNATVVNYSLLNSMCSDLGIKLKLCLLTCANNGNHVGINNNILSAVGESSIGYRFNYSTSVANDGTTINTSLFYDGLHPIEAGCLEMDKRKFIDIPEILK